LRLRGKKLEVLLSQFHLCDVSGIKQEKTMRILMLTQFYPPTIGGEERHVQNLSSELVTRGHDVSVITFWQKGFPEFEIHQGVRIHRIKGIMQHMSLLFSDESRRYAPPFPDPEAVRALRRIILDERPDIVHAHNWLVHSFTPLKAWSRAKFVVSLHDYSLVCVQKRLMSYGRRCTGPGLTKCLKCASHFYGPVKGLPTVLANMISAARERQMVDMYLPVSQAVVEGNQLDKYNVPYRVIPNFIPDLIDVRRDEDNPFLAQLPKEDFLLFVGDVTRDKGAELLIQTYAESAIQVPLVLIGRPFLASLVEHIPHNVFLMGGWPHDAVMGAWSRCSIGLVPSIWAEPCPTVAMEAMSMGKPVIAGRSGGLIDIVADKETGFLVTPGDSQALKEAIQTLLHNRDLRERMGAMAKRRVVKFQAKSVVSRIERVYGDLLKKDVPYANAVIQMGSR
jgi:glycosyltransferase involved in cell wall biosynthesis